MSAAVGKKLRQAREEQELTLEQVAKDTHIRIHYLLAMEAGDFDNIPSRVQARGFLRSYAGYLKIDIGPLFEILEGDALSSFVPEDETVETVASPTEPEASEPDTASESTDEATLASVGETLKNQREVLGLSLDDVARHTHLRVHYLQALELGDMTAMPSPVQGSGMLKNYAEFLGLDPEPMLLRFAEDLQQQLSERKTPQPSRNRPRRAPRQAISLPRRIFSRDILIATSLAIFLISFAVWAGMRISAARSAQEPEPTPPSIADVLLPSPTASIPPTATATIPSPIDEAVDAEFGGPAPEVPQEPIQEEGFAEKAVRVQIVIRQRSYMRIVVDGQVEFDGRVVIGAMYAFAGDESVEILTGNGAGLYVTYNDVDLGLLGTFGEVRNFVLTINGLITPTPTISPTPTNTSRARPTRTPTPSP